MGNYKAMYLIRMGIYFYILYAFVVKVFFLYSCDVGNLCALCKWIVLSKWQYIYGCVWSRLCVVAPVFAWESHLHLCAIADWLCFFVLCVQRQCKVQETQLKCTKARNDYLFNLEATNASMNKYYLQDLSALIDVSVLVWHGLTGTSWKS